MYLGESADPGVDSGSSVFGFIFTWIGALMSAALIAGLGIWGYQLAVRDVSGVPVVRALEGPMRVAPDDPGGAQAEHQGLAVNTVASDGVAAGPAERLVLAPPPLSLSDEDQPSPTLASAEVEEGAETETETEGETEILAMADRIASGVTPLSAPLDAPELAAEETVPEETALAAAPVAGPLPEVIPASVKGVSLSPLPVPRPDGDLLALAVANSVAGAVAKPKAVELDVSEVPEGARLVQFGAFASPEEARTEWARLDARFTDFLSAKKRVIEKAVSGGKTFYRLRAVGFEDIGDARRFCSAFVAERQACIPVVAR
jgi:hypothetical protein